MSCLAFLSDSHTTLKIQSFSINASADWSSVVYWVKILPNPLYDSIISVYITMPHRTEEQCKNLRVYWEFSSISSMPILRWFISSYFLILFRLATLLNEMKNMLEFHIPCILILCWSVHISNWFKSNVNGQKIWLRQVYIYTVLLRSRFLGIAEVIEKVQPM